MASCERHYMIHTDTGTQYRVRPNPDSDKSDGSDGVVIEWRDNGEEKWMGYLFLAPDAVTHVASALLSFTK